MKQSGWNARIASRLPHSIQGGLFIAFPLFCLVALFPIVGVPTVLGQGLPSIYDHIDREKNMTYSEKYEAKMGIFKAGLESGDIYTSHLEKLQYYTDIMSDTGLAPREKFGQMSKEFSDRLGAALDNKTVKRFGTVVKGESYVSRTVGLFSDLKEIDEDPNLNDAARRPLKALRVMGDVMESSGNLPVLGPLIEPAGEAVKELTKKILVTADNINTLKGGAFSQAEERILEGLPTHTNYKRTPLYQVGVTVVEELHAKQGNVPEKAYIKAGKTWREIDYTQAELMVMHYRYVNGKNPSADKILDYLASPEALDTLETAALNKAEENHRHEMFKRVSDKLGVNLFNRDGKHREFLAARNKLQERIENLGIVIPPTSSAFEKLLVDEMTSPGSNNAMLRRMALQNFPGLDDYLKYYGLTDPGSIPIDRLAQIFRDAREADPEVFTGWAKEHLGKKVEEKTGKKTTEKDVTKGTRAGGVRSGDNGIQASRKREEKKQTIKERQEEITKKADAQQEREEKQPPEIIVDQDKDGRPVIPQDCTIDTAGWSVEYPESKFNGIIFIRGGTAMWGLETHIKAKKTNEVYSSERTCTIVFTGTLRDNVITGTSEENCTPMTVSWENTRGGCQRTIYWNYTADERIVFHLDGTFDGTSEIHSRNRWTVNNPAATIPEQTRHPR